MIGTIEPFLLVSQTFLPSFISICHRFNHIGLFLVWSPCSCFSISSICLQLTCTTIYRTAKLQYGPSCVTVYMVSLNIFDQGFLITEKLPVTTPFDWRDNPASSTVILHLSLHSERYNVLKCMLCTPFKLENLFKDSRLFEYITPGE